MSRLSQAAADVSSAVTVIDRETIRASGIVDLPDIFRLVPGMYVGATQVMFITLIMQLVTWPYFSLRRQHASDD